MANPDVQTQFAMPDPNAAPLNLTQLFQLANVLVSSRILGDQFLNVVISATEPDTDDRDKLWIKKDSGGRATEIRTFWNGSWRRVYNGMIGEVRGYTGNPGTDFNDSGLGNVGGNYDGWALMNGHNGTPDLSDKFLIGAHMNNQDHSGYSTSGGWVTWISNTTGQHTGGVRDITLNADNTYRPARSVLKLGKWAADSNAHSSTGQMYGDQSNNSNENVTLIEADAGKPTPPAISTIPPFIALGWITFVGYST